MPKKTTDEYPAIPLDNKGLEVDLFEWVPAWKAWVYSGSYSLKKAIAACLEEAPVLDFAVFPLHFDPNQKPEIKSQQSAVRSKKSRVSS